MAAFFGALVMSIPVGVRNKNKLLCSLRRDHQEIWERLGRPKSWWNSSPANSFEVYKWVLSKTYRETQDVDVIQSAVYLRIAYIIQTTCFALFILTFLLPKGCAT